jgi:hypothetical protein
MSDSYQAIYDAVRSRISGGNISEVVSDALRNAFDFSSAREMLQQQIYAVGYEMARPSVIFKPTLSEDGDHWCALYGEDLATGVCAFGKTPEAAMVAFDKAWHIQKTTSAMKAEEVAEEQAANGQFGVGA